ncbi:MAG: NAD(P)-binding domain-containing protein, partial [Halobacteriovoraceae bacterium]|nr:NAD(P)-binding domain-containing protein [Halobacteriovoraceae bacterium]
TLIGFGSQGQAWAKNLRDSGYSVEVFLRKDSPSTQKVLSQNFSLVKNLKSAKVILLLIPDQEHVNFYKQYGKSLTDQTLVIYAHGASLCEHSWNKTYSNLNHVLLAPKAIASELRGQYLNKGKLGAVYSLEHTKEEDHKDEILSLAKDLGITAGPFEVTFLQETHADLLSEQSLLCGLIPYAAKKCFDFLVSKGIPKELAYMEAWHEVKLIGNAMDKLGPENFFNLISPHAFTGALKAKDKFINESFDGHLSSLFEDIQSGKFFEESNHEKNDSRKREEILHWKESELQKTYENLKSNLT